MLRKIGIFLIGLCMGLAFISFSKAANIYFVPETGNLISNCENNLDIMIDTQGQDIFGASTNIQYDRKNIEIDGFYINEKFNLPRDVEINGLGNIKSAALSMIRGLNYRQTGFTGVIKYATLVIKNKEPIVDTQIDFLFSGQGDTTDNMDVFKLGDAKDILESVRGGVFKFVNGECLHQSPDGINQMDTNYDYQKHINGNLDNIAKLEKKMLDRQRIQKFIETGSYLLILLLIIILIIIMYKKGFFKNINLNIFKNKNRENV